MPARWALVTGGARRIGAAIAERLAADGWNLLLHANRSYQDAGSLAESLTAAHGVEAAVALQDFTDLNGINDFVARCAGVTTAIDLIVNNASVFPYDDVETVNADTLEACFRVNCAAPVLLSRHYAERLCPEHGGAIINMIDAKVARPNARFLSYELSKCGLAAATRGLARALAPRIRVNAVAPGLTLPSGSQTQADFERMHAKTPLEIGVEPAHIVDAVMYLVAAPSVTGQIIAVDAGQALSGDDRTVYDSMS